MRGQDPPQMPRPEDENVISRAEAFRSSIQQAHQKQQVEKVEPEQTSDFAAAMYGICNRIIPFGAAERRERRGLVGPVTWTRDVPVQCHDLLVADAPLFEVAQSSVAKYMVKRRGPPSQGWRTFLRNHVPEIAAMGLFIAPTIGFELLYAIVIVRLNRRELVWINVTTSPTAEWIAR
jgi:hypothetical protein